MKIAFIGDIVGRPGRKIISHHLQSLKDEYGIDCVIANGENASHGFGLTVKNANELFKYGIDVITGGNHTWDKKKDILVLLEDNRVLRPANYPEGVSGSGVGIYDINGTKLAVINLMGLYTMPQCENPFNIAISIVEDLLAQGIKHIFCDFHAEVTAEKRVLFMILKNKISAMCGTHTHVGTDDLQIIDGTFYLTDIGLTGCCDNVIGMESTVPVKKALTGLGGHFKIPNDCKSILQMAIIDIDDMGLAKDGLKIKLYSDGQRVISQAYKAK
ncbi:MAG: YmdB family metallophosphoesterase [Campylobacteraceae bacterium]|nr:YmdB family metallophosphoesterase [Campylobacteraceae bacterium]